MSFTSTWLATGPSTPLSRYTVWNGVFYIATGLLFFAWPGVMQLVGAAVFVGHEEGLVRLLGFMIALIGYFYLFGGRTGATSFGLSTVVDRLLLPLFLVPLAVTGSVDPALVIPFAILDPILGIGAFVIWRRAER